MIKPKHYLYFLEYKPCPDNDLHSHISNKFPRDKTCWKNRSDKVVRKCITWTTSLLGHLYGSIFVPAPFETWIYPPIVISTSSTKILFLSVIKTVVLFVRVLMVPSPSFRVSMNLFRCPGNQIDEYWDNKSRCIGRQLNRIFIGDWKLLIRIYLINSSFMLQSHVFIVNIFHKLDFNQTWTIREINSRTIYEQIINIHQLMKNCNTQKKLFEFWIYNISL